MILKIFLNIKVVFESKYLVDLIANLRLKLILLNWNRKNYYIFDEENKKSNEDWKIIISWSCVIISKI